MEDLLHKLLENSIETEILEFKKAEKQFDRDKLGKYFSALSNEANLSGKPEAWLLFGVNNDKSIAGTSISDKQLSEYKQEVALNTSPTLTFINIHRVRTPQGDVLMLQIPAAPQGMPIAWKDLYYARNGESLVGLNINKIERIREQRTSVDWSAEVIPNATLDDLSPEAIVKARANFGAKNPHLSDEIPIWDDLSFLNKAKITINGQITRTAILLLGKPESDSYLNPSSSKVTWILRDRDNIEKDYAHFFCPLLLEVENVRLKIRNIKYRYMIADTLFPEEVDQFDAYIIREALNNCIAHQDYTLGGKINLVEREDGILTFSNMGQFIPSSIEAVINADAPEELYRNPFLANAMVNLNMIDTIGSGIKKMFVLQKNKYFPLPEYDFSNDRVQVQIIGKVLDINYARKLAQVSDLSLQDIMLLDKVAKGKELVLDEVKDLKSKKLIEGRKPNFYISSKVASAIGEKADYIKQRGIDDEYCQKIILDYLEKFKEGKKADFENILLDKLPDVLDVEQKKNKVKNNLQILRKQGVIQPVGKKWIMSKR